MEWETVGYERWDLLPEQVSWNQCYNPLNCTLGKWPPCKFKVNGFGWRPSCNYFTRILSTYPTWNMNRVEKTKYIQDKRGKANWKDTHWYRIICSKLYRFYRTTCAYDICSKNTEQNLLLTQHKTTLQTWLFTYESILAQCRDMILLLSSHRHYPESEQYKFFYLMKK